MTTPKARERTLSLARLSGSCAVGVVGQIAVDMPAGFFGGRDTVTVAGAAFASFLLLVSALFIVGRRRLAASLPWIFPLLLSVQVGIFLPTVPSDPVVGGAVVLWNLTLLVQHLFPAVAPLPPRLRLAATELDTWLRDWRHAARHLLGVSLALILVVVGYRLSGRLLAQVICLALSFGTLLVALPFLRMVYRRGSRSVLIVVVVALASLFSLFSPVLMLCLLAVAQVATLLLLLAQDHSTNELVGHFLERPSQLVVLSFATVILTGTVFLTFPVASAGPDPIPPLDALFTATSATCVTGLIVLDTATAFSPFGQAILLLLIQIGGLGIMTLSTFATLLLGGSLGLRGERALTQVLDIQSGPTATRLIRFIVLSTLALEGAGAVVLAFSYRVAGFPLKDAVWRGVFHSVSAFCNAGFALQSDSLVLFQNRPAPLLVFAVLIVAGGLGFAVLAGLWSRARSSERRPLTVQVRVVVVTSAVLLVAGTLLYLGGEWDRSLAGLSLLDKVSNALFQSVTLRTAGFNSVGFESIAPATILFMMLFMFIGAAPGSTGGGIKITTLVVLLAALRSIVRSWSGVKLFEREVPRDIVLRSLAITTIAAATVTLGFFLILVFERQPFETLLFESVSAFATVGLSLGATPLLSPAGKFIIIAMMFVGRTGPLTLALFLGTGGVARAVCRYPETRVMVG